jgi:hypothetical protein
VSVRVNIPVRVRVDPQALEARLGELQRAVATAAERAMANSVRVVLEPRGNYLRTCVDAPTFSWGGPDLAGVPGTLRRQAESLLADALHGAAWRAGVSDWGTKADPAPKVLPSNPMERLLPDRYDPDEEQYSIPSYGPPGRKVFVPVRDPSLGPFAAPGSLQRKPAQVKPAAPIDWDAVWNGLRGPDPIDRWDTFNKIRDLVEEGDKQAVTYALSAIRPDGAAPTPDVLAALQTLAKNHPSKFRRVLRAIRVDLRASFGGQEVTRAADNYVINKAYFWLLDVLGGLTRVLAEVPAARELAAEFEREAKGLARVSALVATVVEARIALDRYLTDRRPPTTAQLLHYILKDVPPDVPEDADKAVVEKIRYTTNTLLRTVGLVLAGLTDPDDIYDLETDLIEHHRWITGSLAGVLRIDRALYMYRRLYGDVMDKLEEVAALRESRARYLAVIAGHTFPAATQIVQLSRDADAFAADWYGRAAGVKFGHWAGLAGKLDVAMKPLESVDLVVPDSYNRRLMEVRGALAKLHRELSHFSTLPRGPEGLAQMSGIDREFGFLAIHVAFCQLWHAAHQLMRVFTDKSIGDKDQRAHWRKEIGATCKEIEEQYDKPDMYRLQDNLDLWKESIERYQRHVQATAENEAWIKVGVILLVIVITWGIAAPEGASLIVVTLGEAAIITAASLAVDVALDKPISLSGAAIEFGENFLLFGALKILNAKLFAIALNYPGRTLTRLAIIFGGNFVATTLPPLLVQTIQTGAWPDNIAIFLAGCFALNAVIGAFTAPRLMTALNAMDRARVGDLLLALESLDAGHKAWLADMEAIAKRGTIGPDEFAMAKERGISGFNETKRVVEQLLKFPDTVLADLGVGREALTTLLTEAEGLLAQIQGSVYEAQPAIKRLPAPVDVVPEGLVPTSGNVVEYNPSFPGTRSDDLVRRLRRVGYVVQEEAGVIRLLGPGETEPRFLLLPARSDVPSLSRLVAPGERNVPKGIRVLQAQNAVPQLEPMLTRIAVTDPGGVRQILAGLGRHFELETVNSAASVLAIKGIFRVLEIGGQRILDVALGLGQRYGTPTTLKALGQFNELLPQDLSGIDATIRLLGSGRRGTDAIIGIGRNFVPSRSVYGAIGDLAPHVEGGFEELFRYLMSEQPNLNQAALGSLLAGQKMLAEHPGARIRFELELRRGETLFRVVDVHVTLPPSDPLGFIAAEVKEVADIRILRVGRAIHQFARDVEEALAHPPPAGFRPLARIRWLVRMPAGSIEELKSAHDEVKQILRRAFDENYALRTHPRRDEALQEFEHHFDEIVVFF